MCCWVNIFISKQSCAPYNLGLFHIVGADISLVQGVLMLNPNLGCAGQIMLYMVQTNNEWLIIGQLLSLFGLRQVLYHTK